MLVFLLNKRPSAIWAYFPVYLRVDSLRFRSRVKFEVVSDVLDQVAAAVRPGKSSELLIL